MKVKHFGFMLFAMGVAITFLSVGYWVNALMVITLNFCSAVIMFHDTSEEKIKNLFD